MLNAKKIIITLFTVVCVSTALPVRADKSSVEITAPLKVKKGTTITIKIKVIHSGNNIFHYTDWVYVKANGIEIARWKYKWNKRPENEVFTKEVAYTVNDDVELEAMANCNLHGSTGKRISKILTE